MSGRGRGRGSRRGGLGHASRQSAQSSTTPSTRPAYENADANAAFNQLLQNDVPFIKMTPVELTQYKSKLLNTVSASLIKEPKFDSNNNSISNTINFLVKKVAHYDPEFIVKLALYTRDDLGIRTTANYLVSIASNSKHCQPFVRRYFKMTVKLPSDWLDVAAIYQSLPDKTLQGTALPATLRKAMNDKFPDFDAYQLAKYNKEGSIKRKKKKLKVLMKKDPAKAQELQAQLATAKPTLTIKQMIRQLHISEPVYNVMCILGKKYPSTDEEFRKLKLPGQFERARAGKRMKLPVPETWETLVSAKGNKASTWEELIEHKKLPFMAMLRNLRNLIFTGVQPRYHRWVMNKLNNEETVAQSRQFPFRFFSAYEVIPRDLADFNEKLQAMNADKAEKKSKGKKKDKPLTDKEKRKLEKKHITPQNMPDAELFDKYREALDNAVKHATSHNVKPIRGTTSVFCNTTRAECTTAKGIGKFSQTHELGMLLGLMCKYVCEDCDFRIFGKGKDGKTSHKGVELKDGTILNNMEAVVSQSDRFFPNNSQPAADADDVSFPFDYVEELIKTRRKVDNLIILSHQLVKTGGNSAPLVSVQNILHKYRQEINPDLLFVSVDLSGRGNSVVDGGGAASHPNDVMISGFSDSILRFIAERGDNNQLQYVEHIDEAKKIPKDLHLGNIPAYLEEEDKDAPVLVDDFSVQDDRSSQQAGAWRTARVFISSTFLDMHGERDLLTRHVFPELRERCKNRRIHLFEVDLRWGITEEESQSEKQLEMCLDQVDRCRPFFVGLLGRRYGYIPKEYRVGARYGDPRLDWVKTYPTQRSVTELEMFYGAIQDPSKAHALFYFRDPAFSEKIPQEYKKYFDSEGKEQGAKIDALKLAIRGASEKGSGNVKVWDGYPCKWNGVVDGKPMVGGLDQLAKRMVEDLWASICKVFPQPVAEVKADPLADERLLHETVSESHVRKFVGRKEVLENLTKFCDGASPLASILADNGSAAVVIVGDPGSGKSALASAFLRHYRLHLVKKKQKKVLIISHFIGASPASSDVRKILERMCREVVSKFKIEDVEVPEDYTELKRAFVEILKRTAFLGRVVLVIDGLNQLDPMLRSHTLDWLPSGQIVPSLKVVLTTMDNDNTLLSLKRRKPAPPVVQLKPLDLKERKDLVRQTLAEYHKKLDERPMNDQMRLLLKKTDATVPLYLVLACEELRVFGVYEHLTERLKSLSLTLPKLLEEILHRLEGDHGKLLVSTALSCIACARGGLKEDEITRILKRGDEETLPTAIWTRIYLSISPYLRPIPRDDNNSNFLDFFHKQMQQAVAKRYLETGDTFAKTQKLLARYFLAKADPNGDRTWEGADVRAMAELPYHLGKAKMWKELESVLTDLRFVEKKCELGLAYDLIADYAEACSDVNEPLWPNPESLQKVREFWRFVASSSHVIAKRPHLTYQQAANQPDSAAPAVVATGAGSKQDGRSWIQWLNKPQQYDACKMTLTAFADPVTACAVSRDGLKIACASRDATIKIFDFRSGAETCVLIGHTNWVLDCDFSYDGRLLVSASFDESVKMWDVVLGGEVAHMKGHSRVASCCRFSPDGKEVVSGSWDSTVRVWDTVLGRSQKVLRGHSKPVNAVAYAPNGKHMASASWDGTVRVWDVAEGKEIAVLRELTGASIRDLDFAPSSLQLVTANVNKRVCLWDVCASKLITSLGMHSKPVNGCSYSPDGRLLASTSDDNTVKVWAAVLGKEVNGAAVKTGWMNCVAFDAGGIRLATGTSECMVKIWDAERCVELYTLSGHSRSVGCVAFHPLNNNYVASGSDDGTIRMWEVSNKTSTVLSGHRDCVNSVAFSMDGTKLASASDDFSIKLWDTETGKEIRELMGHSNVVKSVAFSPNGKFLASGSRDCSVRLWQVHTGNLMVQLAGHLDWINCVAFSPDSKKVVSSSWDYNLKVWDIRHNKEVATLKGHGSSVEGCAFSGDGLTIVSCGYDNSLKVWDAVAGSEITTLRGHAKRVNGIALSVTNNKVASVSDDGTLRIWDPMAGTEVATLVGHAASVRGCAFVPSPESDIVGTEQSVKSLVSVSDDCSAKIWDTQHVSVSGHSGWVTSCAFSPDGNTFVSTSEDGTLKVWDVALTNPALRQTIRLGPGEIARSCTFMDGDNTKLVVGHDNNDVTVWDLNSYEAINRMRGHTNAVRCVAAAGGIIASAGWDATVRIWDSSFRQVCELPHKDWVECCALSPTGDLLATGGRDNVIMLWKKKSPGKFDCVAVLEGHKNWVTSLAFSVDGKRLVSTSYDKTVLVWDTEKGTWDHHLVGHGATVAGAAFTSNRKFVLSVGHDSILHLWNCETERITSEFVHSAPATAFAFGQAARLLGSGDAIGNIYLLRYNSKQ